MTWRESDKILGALRTRQTDKIIFLHGYWLLPDTVILDWNSYDRIARDSKYRDDLAASWKTSVWVYVGCGVNGLSDPDFGLLMEHYGSRARDAGHWDFCLLRASQCEEFQAYFEEHQMNICAVSYGEDFGDLPKFLHSLLPHPAPAERITPEPITPQLKLISAATKALNAPREREIDLLNPYLQSIDLVGRERDMESLWQWTHSDRRTAVRTIIGRAGSGKTRLALELLKRLEREHPGKWHAGFANGTEIHKLGAKGELAHWKWNAPTLIVVDYAAPLAKPLSEWLHHLAEDGKTARPLRLLLLEREASQEDGWYSTLRDRSWSGASTTNFFDPLEPIELQKLGEAEQRRAVLSATLAAAGKLLTRTPPQVPAEGENPQFDQSLASETWADPLYLMMAALVSFHEPMMQAMSLSRIDLSFHLADRERERIRRFAPGENPNAARLLVHMCAYASVTGGLTSQEALAASREECEALGLQYSDGPGALAHRLNEILPAQNGGLAAIFPDIIAEAFVLRTWKLETDAVIRAAAKFREKVIAFVIRMGQAFSWNSEDHVPEPLIWMKALIESAKDNLEQLVVFERAMPQQTVVWAPLAAKVCELMVAELQALNQRGLHVREALAQVKNNLANRLSDLGRREEALEAANQALTIYEQLSKMNREAFLPGVAGSLNNLANRLSDLGRWKEAFDAAKEAVAIYGELSNMNGEAFRPYLAMSLHNLANRLSNLGRREEAFEAAKRSVVICGELSEINRQGFRPYLASSLNTLAGTLSALGRRKEAHEAVKEAVAIYEELSKERPEAFQPDLAMSLYNLAGMLSNLGRQKEALETEKRALEIYEELSTVSPKAFLPDLAMSLNNLANMLSDLGRPEEALEAAKRAVAIYKEHSKTSPEPFRPDAAMALNNLANWLSAHAGQEEAP